VLTFHDFGVKRGTDGKRIASKPVRKIVQSHGVLPQDWGQDLLELYDDIDWFPIAFVVHPSNTVVVVREKPC